MYTLILLFIILAALLMVGIVLIQESKGGGLASSFVPENKSIDVHRAMGFLEKSTWVLGGIIMALCVMASHFIA